MQMILRNFIFLHKCPLIIWFQVDLVPFESHIHCVNIMIIISLLILCSARLSINIIFTTVFLILSCDIRRDWSNLYSPPIVLPSEKKLQNEQSQLSPVNEFGSGKACASYCICEARRVLTLCKIVWVKAFHALNRKYEKFLNSFISWQCQWNVC